MTELDSDVLAPLARSYLYVPGDRERLYRSARSRGADAVIIDLEDAVAASRKEAAYAEAHSWLERQRPGVDEIWVRLDPTRMTAQAPLARLPGVTGIVLPKASVAAVDALDSALDVVDHVRDVPVPIIALIESAAALASASEIAEHRRVCRLGVGRADLFAELGLDAEHLSLAHLSALWLTVVVASAAAGIDPPIAPVETDLNSSDLTSSTQEFAHLGFRARTAIHPGQVAVINEVFTPTAEQVEAARARVTWFDQATRSGSGVAVDPDGVMVDEAVIRSARQVLRRWRAEPPVSG